MQTITVSKHRGKPALRFYVGGKPRYRVIKDEARIDEERIELAAELLAGPKPKPPPRPAAATLDEHLADYKAELLAELGERRRNYVGQVITRIHRVADAARITRIEGITASKVSVAIAGLRKPCRKPLDRRKPTDPPTNPLSEQTRNFYLQAVKQFTRWCVKTKRLAENPLSELRKRKVRVRPNKRDRFQPAELIKLVKHTLASDRIVESLDGESRAVLYALAAMTGLRKSELGSLTPSSFSLVGDQPQVCVASGYTKNGDPATLPLHATILPLLHQKLTGLNPGDLLWEGLAEKDTAKAIQADMKDAGLLVVTAIGRRCFHSLRNAYISGLLDQGVDIATVQKLARHADASTTLSYARPMPDGERLAIQKLPGLGL